MKIFISLFLFIISTSSFADDITHAGVVRIEGLITEKTCIISDESKNFTANMPDVPSSSVRSAGDVTEKVYFSITLTRCGSDVGNAGNDSNLLIVFYVQIMPDDLVMQL
ncbi:fimbrial protein, partial [Escherichia coli]